VDSLLREPDPVEEITDPLIFKNACRYWTSTPEEPVERFRVNCETIAWLICALRLWICAKSCKIVAEELGGVDGSVDGGTGGVMGGVGVVVGGGVEVVVALIQQALSTPTAGSPKTATEHAVPFISVR
jgi:hypothetical protein